MDCKIVRKESTLHIHHLALESNVFGNDDFLIALRKELEFFLEFYHCCKLRLHKNSPANVRTELGSIIGDLS